MKPFNIQEYFKNLGDGWRINTITESIFFKNEEVIFSRSSIRKVLTQLLKQRRGFKIYAFLRSNFGAEDDFPKKENHINAWARAMYLSVEKILHRYGFMIKVNDGGCSKETEWSLCYADK